MYEPIPKPVKRANGKGFKSWSAFRRKYLKQNPPSHEGYYSCAICFTPVLAKEITLDHIIPRSRRPDLRCVTSNIQFACYACNYEKGSTYAEM